MTNVETQFVVADEDVSSVYSDLFAPLSSRIVVRNISPNEFVVFEKCDQDCSLRVHLIPCGKRTYVRLNDSGIKDLAKFSHLEDVVPDGDKLKIIFENDTKVHRIHCSLNVFTAFLEHVGPRLDQYITSLQNDVNEIYDMYRPEAPRWVFPVQPVQPLPSAQPSPAQGRPHQRQTRTLPMLSTLPSAQTSSTLPSAQTSPISGASHHPQETQANFEIERKKNGKKRESSMWRLKKS